MIFQYDNILLQMLVVIFPIILYQALLNNRKLEKKEPFYWALVFAVSMGLCILFAIIIADGIILDLRMVPWFLAFIYGGQAVGIFVTVTYVIIRFWVGGEGMIPAFIVLLLGTMVIWKFKSFYINKVRREKIILAVSFLIILSMLIPTIGTILLDGSLTVYKMIIDIGFVLANGLTVWLAVHLFESYREKQELVKEIQKNEKLHVVGQVAASVAHEIRNPMTSVRGFVQLLAGSKHLDEAEKSYLTICLDELDRANEIISDYLSLGKNNDTDHQSIVDLSKLSIKSVNTLVSYASINNVSLSLETSQGSYIIGNSGRIQQMLVNLIKNAIEAARPDGNVKVKVAVLGESAEITIADNGIGMSSEQVENIGLPYYSTKEKGTGLGLMVTLQAIKEMNGSWKVESQINKGTIFHLSFPVIKND